MNTNHKIIFLVILGITLFFIRTIYYIELLGWMLDFIWSVVFAVVLYKEYNQLIWIFVPAGIGFVIELVQFICANANISFGYYPGTADIKDIIAYSLASIIIFIYYTSKLNVKNSNAS